MNIRVRTGIIILLLLVEMAGIAGSLPETLYRRRKIDSLLRILPLSSSQQRIDVLMELSKQYQSISMDSSREYAQLALDEAKDQQNNPAIANAYKSLGSVHYFLGNYGEVLQFYDSSVRFYAMINDSSGLAKVWNNLGLVFQKIGDYQKSIDYHIKSLECKIALADSVGIANSYNNIGSIYYDLENYEKSFEYFDKALHISERLENEENEQSILNNLGLISQEEEKYTESLEFFKRSMDIGERINNKRGLADTYHNRGKSYFEMGEYKQALADYFKAFELYNEIGIESSHTLNNIGQLYIELDYYSQAKKYLMQALKMARDNNQFIILRDIYQNLSIVYERTGQFSDALNYYKLFNVIEDSIKNQMYSSRLEDVHNKYELEKYREQFRISERENELKLEMEVRRRNILLYSISAILLAFLVFIVIVLRVLRQKARANIILQEQNEEIVKSDNIIKKINKALKENEEMLRSIFDASPYSIIVINEEKKIIDCNQTSLKTFGVRKKRDMIKKYFDDLFIPQQVETARENFSSAIENRSPQNNRFDLVKENGTTFPAELSGRVIKDDSGKMIAYIAIITDITERITFIQNLEKAKTDAEASDRLKTAFLANMSHEIRTPMNAIVGFSNLLSDSKLPEAKKEEYLDHIIQSSNMLLNLIDDIIDISKIEAGQISINRQEFRVNKVVQDVFKTFSNVSKKRNLDFRLNIPPSSDSISLNTDPVRLRQILGNLIGNAVKFTERGYIEIGYEIRENGNGPNIRFFVKDSGIGIPKDKQSLIFERFRQLDDTRTRRFGGTGLGLSISKKLVDLLGGAIWVESQPGVGSEFYFTIPYIKEKTLPPVEPETFSFAKYNWKNKTLLIAEDENSNFELIKASISKTGIRIIRAMNGEEALEIARTNDDIDLILMDIRMPKMNGYDATRNIKSIKPELPIISITAYAMSEDEEKSLEAGCDRYISKPIRPARLLELIDEYLS